MNGIKIFHFGDATIDFMDNIKHLKKFNIGKENIDILFIEYFDNSEETRNFIKEVIKPKYIVYMHIPPSGIFDITEQLTNIEDQDFPEIIIFKGKMGKMRFQKKILGELD